MFQCEEFLHGNEIGVFLICAIYILAPCCGVSHINFKDKESMYTQKNILECPSAL